MLINARVNHVHQQQPTRANNQRPQKGQNQKGTKVDGTEIQMGPIWDQTQLRPNFRVLDSQYTKLRTWKTSWYSIVLSLVPN